jgi:hypothetical protein
MHRNRPCPLYPRKRTFVGAHGICATGAWRPPIESKHHGRKLVIPPSTISWPQCVAANVTPIRRFRSGCCALAANGSAAAEPTTVLMKSRRSWASRLWVRHLTDISCPSEEGRAHARTKAGDVRFGSLRTFAVQSACLALAPKADRCGATRDVRFGP